MTYEEQISVPSCQFFPHAKIHCIMATLNKLFKIEFESAETEKEPRKLARFAIRHSFKINSVIVPTFDTKVTEYLCSGWVFFSSDKFRLFI